MRSPSGIAAMASLFLLAGCGGGGAANNGASAATPAAKALTPERRARQIQACIENASSSLPAGTNANAFCGCAVDKMANGMPQRNAVIECADEMHIQLQSG